MTPRLLELNVLCCPMCRGSLHADIFAQTQGAIEEGRFTCVDCGRRFPIINGIPRLLPDGLRSMTLKFHADFFHRYASEMATPPQRDSWSPSDGWWKVERRTVSSYSYQWRKFKEMLPHWEQVFQDSVRPIEPAFFRGKRGVDAGCGFGRSLSYAASYGAEVIGIDLSEAVEAARENTRQLPGVHLIQADMYHLPLREGVFDFVYSLGVLHHLPDPKRAFQMLTRLLKPEAPIFIWVYARGRGRQIPFLTMMRAVSTRLPLRLLDPICFVLAAGQWGLWIVPYRLLNRSHRTQALARRLPFTFYARYPFRVLYTDWFDGLSVPLVNYYRQEEIKEWFRDAGLELECVAVGPEWGGRALGRQPALARPR